MVALYVGGNKVESMADIERLFANLNNPSQNLEFRNERGELVRRFIPEPICPWDPSLTRERIEEMCKQGGRKLKDILKDLETR